MAVSLFPSVVLLILLNVLYNTLACGNFDLNNTFGTGSCQLHITKTSPNLVQHIYLKSIDSPTPQYGDAFEFRVYNGDYMRNLVYFSLFEVLPMDHKLSKLYRMVDKSTNQTKCVISVFKQMAFAMEPWEHFSWLLYPASV